MVELRVDYATLDNLTRSLGRVAEGLEQLQADCEVTGRAWGGRVVRSAMDDFVDNWGVHREKVSSAVLDLAADCNGVAATFRSLEQGLNQAVADGSGPRRAS